MSENPFGVDHEIAKFATTLAATGTGAALGSKRAKKKHKGEASVSGALRTGVGALGGEVVGTGIGAVATRGRPAGIIGGSIGGTVGGAALGNRSAAKKARREGWVKKSDERTGHDAFDEVSKAGFRMPGQFLQSSMRNATSGFKAGATGNTSVAGARRAPGTMPNQSSKMFGGAKAAGGALKALGGGNAKRGGAIAGAGATGAATAGGAYANRRK